MFNNEIMKQGEKIKRIRKLFHMTQEELAEGICSKNNISLIENNKQKISSNLANLFVKRLNKIAKEKRMLDIKFIADDFLQDEHSQANNFLKNNIINELRETETIYLFEQKLRKAEELIEKYNIADNKKVELYKLAADFYYYKQSYFKSDQMCDSGLEISINTKNKFEETTLYIYKSRNYIFMENYIKSLQELDMAEKLNNYLADDDISVMILYQRALTYKKLGEYDVALKYLKMLKEKYIKDKTMLLKIKMVYANCFLDKNEFKENEFEEAEKEYFEIFDIAHDDKDLLALGYRNLAELYFNNGKYEEAAKYIKDALIYSYDNKYLDEILYIAAKILAHENEDVEQYLLQALDICESKDRENLDLIKDVINELVVIYMKREDEKKLMLMADKAKALNINYCLSYAKISEYYRGRNEEKSIYFSNELIDKLKQI
ncbi:helix-turn-helix transcriptional regulator [Clostridium sp. YIM B02555]|uniref:helix-turn-helix domain-containing protein n=1 Tax=Clostridium sp. YIM B02555 TaxID=2911968 RepID=UPI001EEF46E9|nr:helix-turn-helix transcriptional regulator [Clostridium sp. YIM B02555]